MREKLATFVHISDLHFGRLDPFTGDAELSPGVATTCSNMPWLDGLLGHHGRALKELHAFVADLKKSEPDLRLIVSGDLSTCGDVQELEMARKFIEARIDINPPLQNLIGLRLGEQKLVIPGNHDHWGGTPHPFGTGGSQYSAQFPRKLPFVEPVYLKNGKQIAFIGIDSDADVKPRSRRRTFANGAFQSELNKLNASGLLPAKPSDEFRILLIHHSWGQDGLRLRMARSSKWALGHFIYTHQISAVLSGHSHLALLKAFHAKAGSLFRDVYELRAGSTTQLDVVPPHWRTLANQLPVKQGWNANSLLVHRIYQNDAAMEWETEPYIRGKRGFKPLPGHPPTKFDLL